MSLIDPEYERKLREKIANRYTIPESQKEYYRLMDEDAKRREEFRKKHPILAALFG